MTEPLRVIVRVRLTASMRDTLTAAARQELRRVLDDHAGAPPWPAPWQSLRALVRAGMLTQAEVRNRKGYRTQVWVITQPGRDALAPVVRARPDRPVFMADRSKSTSDYTHNPGRAIDLLEVVDPGELDQAWFGGAVRKHAEAQDRRERARVIRNGKRAA